MKCLTIFENAAKALQELNLIDDAVISRMLMLLADEAERQMPSILSENQKDLMLMQESDPRFDRLQLTPERIKSIAADIRIVAGLSSPSGKILSEYIKPNGLVIKRVTVPFGVIGVIYEARPNVTFDVFSLCMKSGNVIILKGGSDATNSNNAITGLIKKVLRQCGISEHVITLMPPGREETSALLKARGYVDLLIPRGSRELINYVRENASVPVIETGAGICHSYFDESGDVDKGRAIINNAKTRRVSVCNALDCLIIHESRLSDLSDLIEPCASSEVIIYADKKAFSSLQGKYPVKLLKRASSESFGTEFLSYKMAIKTVPSFADALEHIAKYGTRHSEAIISEDESRSEDFCLMVDASSVYTNASTAFTDGAEFGLGAEIGISTQKLHARGPMALEALTTYKWIIKGNGQIRP
ncbi:MAG: glutamate-5-semialdehyde dehydrogenase [Bacteroidales bacterium]|nr:glutamate-5-semialdehyde dehydrogenase [Bacteroidales bacterium]